ncbi:UNVERIFIED_CONTAM: hypothetical protein Sindi_2432700 [Sesamum indicum]
MPEMRYALSLCLLALLLLLFSHSPTPTSAYSIISKPSNEILSPSLEQESLALDSLEKSRKMVVQIKNRLRTRIPVGPRARPKSLAVRDNTSRLNQVLFVLSFSLFYAFLM